MSSCDVLLLLNGDPTGDLKAVWEDNKDQTWDTMNTATWDTEK